MKRDMELIRLLLLEVEQGKASAGLEAYSDEQQSYHAALLVEKGLVEGEVVRNNHGFPTVAAMIHLTWEGHDFLDSARNETIWKKAIALVKSKGVEASIELMKQLLVQLTKSELGLS